MLCFTKKDVGCYADASFGHQHCRDVLGRLVLTLARRKAEAFGGPNKASRGFNIASELALTMSDDASEELEALDYLNEHSADDVVWEFVDGDLMLSINDNTED